MSLKYPRPSDAAVELLRAPTRLLALVVLLLPLPPEANPCVEEALEEEPLELEPEEVVVVLPVLPPDKRWWGSWDEPYDC